MRQLIREARIEELIETIVISSEVGIAKPDPRVYKIVLERLGVDPSETLMIDDNPINVDGATFVGMQGLLFRSYAQLRADCQRW